VFEEIKVLNIINYNNMLDSSRSIWPNFNEEKPYAVLVMGLLFIAFFALVVKVVNDSSAYKYIGRAPLTPNTITVFGEGKADGVPDIAIIDLGILTTSKKVSEAQDENDKKMNDLIERLRKLGLKSEDMKTVQYYINPRYDYVSGRSVLAGYDVQQALRVKIHELDKIGLALVVAGEAGANQIGGLSITIDDTEPLRARARAKALSSARSKAETMAGSLGARLGRIVSFSETSLDDPLPYAREGYGIGGGAPVAAPNIQSGSFELISSVALSYEIY